MSPAKHKQTSAIGLDGSLAMGTHVQPNMAAALYGLGTVASLPRTLHLTTSPRRRLGHYALPDNPTKWAATGPHMYILHAITPATPTLGPRL
jgi:hypothetical protein